MNRIKKTVLLLIGAVILGACSINFSTSRTGGNKGDGGWETYKSDDYGYSIQHPKGWRVVDKSSETTRQIYVYEPDNRAYVKIDAYKEDRLDSVEAIADVSEAFKEKISAEPGMVLTQFNESVEGNVGGYIAIGEQTVDDQLFLFENRGLFSTNGRAMLFHRSVLKDLFTELDETLTKIINSFSLE